jgi:predicted small lipoprotein YifL
MRWNMSEHITINARMVIGVLALAGALALSACGQKGNLYLPDEGATPVPSSTAPQPDPDRDDAEPRRN